MAALAEDGFAALLARVRRALARASGRPAARLRAGRRLPALRAGAPRALPVMFGRDLARSHGASGRWASWRRPASPSSRARSRARSAPVRWPGATRGPPRFVLWSALHGLASLRGAAWLERQGLARGRGADAGARGGLERVERPGPQAGGDAMSSRRQFLGAALPRWPVGGAPRPRGVRHREAAALSASATPSASSPRPTRRSSEDEAGGGARDDGGAGPERQGRRARAGPLRLPGRPRPGSARPT